ncbi:FecR family protein [Pedobacter rhodius]|uniref:DUF4974 domain-containing protein n=1 Tax=Pedobacter rhodius TaxID=3004098 RepID=A0ABT4KWG5_9SPHI|nr:FecR domain-containing protein [Pedobacter sp. SJ11]MCZ4223264.1 DUF4974 domain-containing protein [Pedobacter sp. SJ11]
MIRKNVLSILEKIRSGNFNSREESIAKYWLHHLNLDKHIAYSDEDFERIGNEMWEVLMYKKHSRAKKIQTLWNRITSAAAVIILISACIFFYNRYANTFIKIKVPAINLNSTEIPPGKVSATLVLADGRKIKLSGKKFGEIGKGHGISVLKSVNGELTCLADDPRAVLEPGFTLVTAKGETYMWTLPDKSKIWLNAASSLTYNAALDKTFGARQVYLDGEAYFEVTHNVERPFKVKSNSQLISVLGTHFNVSAYHDDEVVKTTLLNGKVLVAPASGKGVLKSRGVYLIPGEEASLHGKTLKVKKVDAESALDWKTDRFVFRNENIRSIMKKISRWYNVDVEFQGDAAKFRFGGSVSKTKNLKETLKNITLTGDLRIKIEGRRVIVMR